MTTYQETIAPCPLCGQNQEVKLLMSTSTFGSADLDTRPPLMARATLDDLVHRCTKCDYVWRTTGEEETVETEAVKPILASQPYCNALAMAMPGPACSYLARSVLEAQMKNYAIAGWNALHAAWVCDDHENEAGALTARRMAIRLWQRAERVGQDFTPQEDAQTALLCDLMRRINDFNGARELAEQTLKETDHEIISKVLAFTVSLCEAEDAGCHTIQEALEASA